MRWLAALGAGLTLVACQPVPAAEAPADPVPRPGPGAPVETDCDLVIVFGSYGGGADGALRERVRELLTATVGVRDVSEKSWGREGESTFCVHADTRAADGLYATIASWIPDDSRLYPTSVSHRDGRRHEADWPTEENQ